jgi:hypothetical protein
MSKSTTNLYHGSEIFGYDMIPTEINKDSNQIIQLFS